MAVPPRPSDPKSGGNKQALMDAFASAKSDNAGPNVAPDEPDAGPPGGGDIQQVQLQLQHLQNVLIAKAILSPQDVISIPSVQPPGGGDPSAMGGPPGAPPGMPPGMPPPGPPQGAPPLQ